MKSKQRHLELEVIVIDCFDVCIARVSTQTHRNYNFCADGYIYKFSDKVKIDSSNNPNFYVEASHIRLCVRGDSENKDNQVFLIPLVHLSAVSSAIRAYNNEYDSSPNWGQVRILK